jgi:ribosomal protein S27AE
MARFKECFKCKTVQPLTEFYKHQAMADGHLNKCKTCTKNDVATHRLQNIEKIRAYDRRRAKLPKRAKAAQEISAAWRQADKRRMKAHNAVARALKAGKLVRQPCIRCGEQKSIAHHEDYDYLLKVMWLCQPCHKQRHKELNATSF